MFWQIVDSCAFPLFLIKCFVKVFYLTAVEGNLLTDNFCHTPSFEISSSAAVKLTSVLRRLTGRLVRNFPKCFPSVNELKFFAQPLMKMCSMHRTINKSNHKKFSSLAAIGLDFRRKSLCLLSLQILQMLEAILGRGGGYSTADP